VFQFPSGAGIISGHRVQTGSVAHQVSFPVGSGALSRRLKRLGYEAYHSPPSSAEVNAWNYTCTPP